jgi:hypothetical protein
MKLIDLPSEIFLIICKELIINDQTNTLAIINLYNLLICCKYFYYNYHRNKEYIQLIIKEEYGIITSIQTLVDYNSIWKELKNRVNINDEFKKRLNLFQNIIKQCLIYDPQLEDELLSQMLYKIYVHKLRNYLGISGLYYYINKKLINEFLETLINTFKYCKINYYYTDNFISFIPHLELIRLVISGEIILQNSRIKLNILDKIWKIIEKCNMTAYIHYFNVSYRSLTNRLIEFFSHTRMTKKLY